MKTFFIIREHGRDHEEIEAVDVGDEYHTMSELYEHRMALNAAFFKYLYDMDVQVRGSVARHTPYIVKSKLHHDKTMFEGYFIVSMNGPDGQISYHYDLKHWNLFEIPAVDFVPWKYDGHTSRDVIERLLKL